MDRYVQSIRYPPFELEHVNPTNIPISKATIDNFGMRVTNFTIGSEDDWFVQWTGQDEQDAELLKLECEITDSPPRFLTDTRVGWFIRPDRLHNISRKLIIPTVTLLILSLFVHAIEPGLVEQGIIGETIAGSISIGPLDYPRCYSTHSHYSSYHLYSEPSQTSEISIGRRKFQRAHMRTLKLV